MIMGIGRKTEVLAAAAIATASLDKPNGYAKGDVATLTIVDPNRSTSTNIPVPVIGTTLTAVLVVTALQGQPGVGSPYTFTLKSDNPATGTSVWTTQV